MVRAAARGLAEKAVVARAVAAMAVVMVAEKAYTLVAVGMVVATGAAVREVMMVGWGMEEVMVVAMWEDCMEGQKGLAMAAAVPVELMVALADLWELAILVATWAVPLAD